MNSHIRYSLISLVILGMVVFSCKKEEGLGGTSSIKGKVVIRQYNSNFTSLTEQYYATDEDVFIIYGDDAVYGDKVTTNYDGTYEFEFLRKGDYKIFSYSKDSANYPTKHLIPVIVSARISGKKETVQAKDIIILK
jgi:hypothetical protein